MLKRLALFSLVCFVLLAAPRCKKDDPQVDDPSTEHPFDKQGMLVSVADNLIIPSYNQLTLSLDSLSNAYAQFRTGLTTSDLKVLRARFNSAYRLYQRVSVFGFGPGEDAAIRINSNIFPADTSKINANIASGSYALSAASNISAKGFPALEFLLFMRDTAGTVAAFSQSENRRKYAADLFTDLISHIRQTRDAWHNGYRSTFINSTGTDIGSSIGFLLNQLNYELDYLKNSKFATPLGLRSDGTPRPDNSEGFYTGNSILYAEESLRAIENLYRGRSYSGHDGLGFDDYSAHLAIQHSSGLLTDAINLQFADAYAKIAAIRGPLSAAVISDKTAVDNAYRALVKLLVLLKTDLPSGLGVVITYQDGDGD